MGLLVLLDQGVAINSIVSMSFLAYASHKYTLCPIIWILVERERISPKPI